MSKSGGQAVVIGAGLGGLATSLRLAVRGCQVLLLEQGPQIGGKMNTWEEGGYRFDTGPSLITMPWVFRELYQEIGLQLDERLTLRRVDPLTRYTFPDGTQFETEADPDSWNQTIRGLSPDDESGWRKFMTIAERLFNVSWKGFMTRPFSVIPQSSVLGDMFRIPPHVFFQRYDGLVKSCITSPHLRQMLNRYPTYVGSSPYACPAMLAVIPYIEFAFGGWYIQGGLYRLVQDLAARAEELGVRIRTGARVTAIRTDRLRVAGVELASGATEAADLVVFNGDAATLSPLLGNDKERSGRDRSMSGFVMLLGTDRPVEVDRHHNVFFSEDYETEFRQIFSEVRFPDDPTVYVNVPSRSDRSLAPGDGDTVFIMANAPASPGAAWDESKIAGVEERIWNRLVNSGFPDIRASTVVKRTFTPRVLERNYLAPGGAIYGDHSHHFRTAFLRPPNRDRHVSGLYRVGGSAHPGGGTPMVVLSSKIVAEAVDKNEVR